MLISLLLFSAVTGDPAYAHLDRAYAALRANNLPQAISAFRSAAAASPKRSDIRKDLVYALLKAGENEDAREELATIVQLEPGDTHMALEYAFLCHESRRTAEARRIFDRVRRTGNATAEQAFQNIDGPLRDGIARWLVVVERSPDNFSAQEELARLAEQRDQLDLAAEHYEKAWRLRPKVRSLLLDLGRVRSAQGRQSEAFALLLAASRSDEPRVGESALELLPKRYPYVYEFREALEIDPGNIDLRRELAYLFLAMDRKAEAEAEFQIVAGLRPDDLLSVAQLGFLRLNRQDTQNAMPLLERVLAGKNEELAEKVREALRRPGGPRARAAEARTMAERSLDAGYYRDALKFLTIAHENDPANDRVKLKLGWTNNFLHRDGEAFRWFRETRGSRDPLIAQEAERAYQNLRPEYGPVRLTVWSFPFFSSRWKDAFHYAQVKTEFRIGSLPLRPYLSARFLGDVRARASVALGAGLLSENAVILGMGVATRAWKGITAWAEAGRSVAFVVPKGTQQFRPDYRGGISGSRSFGPGRGNSAGRFLESTADAVYVSRFDRDTLFYSQNRAGYSFGPWQVFWNANLTTDVRRQYWANFGEHGPGVRLPIRGASLFTHVLRGHYLVNQGNPRAPVYWDVRAGIWYAFTN